MARPLSWRRTTRANFGWPSAPSTIWNQAFAFNWDPGVTLTRIVGNLRFWVTAAQAALTADSDLYVNYHWGLVWDDGSVPNINTKNLSNNMPELQNHVLYMESFSMRDAWTPAKYNGVDIGFIDDRTSTYFESHAQRRSAPVAPKTACQVRFMAKADVVGSDFGINFAPRLSISFLDRAADTV